MLSELRPCVYVFTVRDVNIHHASNTCSSLTTIGLLSGFLTGTAYFRDTSTQWHTEAGRAFTPSQSIGFQTPRMVGDFPLDYILCIFDQQTSENPWRYWISLWPVCGWHSLRPNRACWSIPERTGTTRTVRPRPANPSWPIQAWCLNRKAGRMSRTIPHFPNVILQTGERYRHISLLCFRQTAHHNG